MVSAAWATRSGKVREGRLEEMTFELRSERRKGSNGVNSHERGALGQGNGKSKGPEVAKSYTDIRRVMSRDEVTGIVKG